jgi:hypothetical protein
MESAIHLNNAKDLENINLDRYSRVYFGTEFCERLLPDYSELSEIVRKVKEKGKALSFLTPPVTEDGINKTKRLLEVIDKDDEVVVNDYGIIELINKEFKNPIIIGRVIGRNILLTLKSSNNNNSLIKTYLNLISSRLTGFEVDHFNYKVAGSFPEKGINFSFYDGFFGLQPGDVYSWSKNRYLNLGNAIKNV